MSQIKATTYLVLTLFFCCVFSTGGTTTPAHGRDLDEIKKEGVLRHIGVPYGSFVTGSGDGMDMELVQLFAEHIGVNYEYVKSSWETVISDLVGRKVKIRENNVELLESTPVRGDIVANGFTILPWREKVVNFSTPTFPTQIVLVAEAGSKIEPIKPSNNMNKDIADTKKLTRGKICLGVKNTCLDPDLYNLSEEGAITRNFVGALDDLSAAVVKGESELAVLEMPDAMLALKKNPGKLKIIGPLSPVQKMGAGFAKDSPELLAAFNAFLEQCKMNGIYLQIVTKYYPSAPSYYPAFFE